MKIVPQSATLLHHTFDAQRLIELAGRTCYKSEGKITDDSHGPFIKMLIIRGYESVLEHACATIRFVIDRGVSHELVRHRLCAFSQESTRYCDYAKTDGLEFIKPPGLEGSTLDIWIHAVSSAETRYMELRGHGVPPEIARSVLPNALKTEIVVTANLREWRHILRLRCSPKAHPQMREVMLLAKAQLSEIAPDVFADL
jgi:thymidylate synthase (FAD)